MLNLVDTLLNGPVRRETSGFRETRARNPVRSGIGRVGDEFDLRLTHASLDGLAEFAHLDVRTNHVERMPLERLPLWAQAEEIGLDEVLHMDQRPPLQPTSHHADQTIGDGF